MNRMKLTLIAVALFLLAGCAAPAPSPTATPAPSPTPEPTATPVPTPTPAIVEKEVPTEASPTPCAPAQCFAEHWAQVKGRLGCPTEAEKSMTFAEEPFEHGRMFWRSDLNRIYVLYDDGTWQWFEDTFVYGQPWYSCPDDETPSSSPPTPKWGFGIVWCTQPGVREKIGWAEEAERDYQDTVQTFEAGLMIMGKGEVIYVLYNDGTWELPSPPPSNLIGTWQRSEKYGGVNYVWQFNEDGTWRIARLEDDHLMLEGRYWFKDGILFVEDVTAYSHFTSGLGLPAGSYEVEMTDKDHFNLQTIDDLSSYRESFNTDATFIRVSP